MSEIDVVLSKINIIKNCLMAIEKASLQISDEYFLQSIFEINLQRAIQACIDLANIVLSKEGLGLPNSYRRAFELLREHAIIDEPLEKILISMVGFRNISVHDYEVINPAIVKNIVQKHLSDFERFYTIIHGLAIKWKAVEETAR